MMKIVVLAACFAISASAFARGGGHSGGGGHHASGTSHSVAGHVTKRGTYVAPTRATNGDHTRVNNYSHKGNVNPYNGKRGAKG